MDHIRFHIVDHIASLAVVIKKLVVIKKSIMTKTFVVIKKFVGVCSPGGSPSCNADAANVTCRKPPAESTETRGQEGWHRFPRCRGTSVTYLERPRPSATKGRSSVGSRQ